MKALSIQNQQLASWRSKTIRLAIEQGKLVEYLNGRRKNQLTFPNAEQRNFYRKGDLIMTGNAEMRYLKLQFPVLKKREESSMLCQAGLLLLGIKKFEDFLIDYGYLIVNFNGNHKKRAFVDLQPVMILDSDTFVEIGGLQRKRLSDIEVSFNRVKKGFKVLKSGSLDFVQLLFDNMFVPFGGSVLKVGGKKLIKKAAIEILAESIKDVILKGTKEAIKDILIPLLREYYKKNQRLQQMKNAEKTISFSDFTKELNKVRNGFLKETAKVAIRKVIKKFSFLGRNGAMFSKIENMILVTLTSNTIGRILADVSMKINTFSPTVLLEIIFNAFKKEFVNIWKKELINLKL